MQHRLHQQCVPAVQNKFYVILSLFLYLHAASPEYALFAYPRQWRLYQMNRRQWSHYHTVNTKHCPRVLPVCIYIDRAVGPISWSSYLGCQWLFCHHQTEYNKHRLYDLLDNGMLLCLYSILPLADVSVYTSNTSFVLLRLVLHWLGFLISNCSPPSLSSIIRLDRTDLPIVLTQVEQIKVCWNQVMRWFVNKVQMEIST